METIGLQGRLFHDHGPVYLRSMQIPADTRLYLRITLAFARAAALPSHAINFFVRSKAHDSLLSTMSIANSESFSALASVRRSKMVSTTTASNIMADESISLNKIMDLLRKANVQGPFVFNECHQGAVRLGHGAQFEVFGRRMSVASSLPTFDGPCLEKRTLQADPNPDDNPAGPFYTTRHVAIKRTYLSESRLRAGALPATSRTVQGVERTQLRDIIHEVLALIHPRLRKHPNVATLPGWGYDQVAGDQNAFSPVLIVEHATMSAEDLCDKVRPPLGIRRHVCAGLLEGIKALHECGIIHNDVKPSNLLIYARNDPEFPCIAKISDFGFAQGEVHEQSLDVSKLPRETAGWAAPEQDNGFCVSFEFLNLRDISRAPGLAISRP